MIAFKYLIFALFSIAINLFFQYISFLIYGGALSLYLALFIGTFAGLFVKYILDKKYIFHHKPKNKKDDGKKFVLYSFMGVFTTVIFWGFEIGFDKIFEYKEAKYLGGFLGLIIGYIVKYFLDKRFVFRESYE